MSALFWLAIWVPYVTVLIVVWRLVAGHLAWTFLEHKRNRWPSLYDGQKVPDGDQWFSAACLGLLVALFWPAVPLVVWAGHLPIAVGAEARNRARIREDRIKQLERELELERI